jgi:hypothetical protein
MKKFFYLNIFLLFSFCSQPVKDRHFSISKTAIENVSDKIIDIETNENFSFADLSIVGTNLVILDVFSQNEKSIYLYDKNSFQPITSTGILGEGPGEILRIGDLVNSNHKDKFWIPDFGKLLLYEFNIDSLVKNSNYKPQISYKFDLENFLSRSVITEQGIAYGSKVQMLTPSTFRTNLGKWNMNSGELLTFAEEHPKLLDQKTNAFFDYSFKYHLMTLSYTNFDLISVFDEYGKIKFNIIGEKEFDNEDGKLNFFGENKVTDQYIITAYLGDYGSKIDENQRPKKIFPSKILFFNWEGKLIKVLDTTFGIMRFTVDEDNKRIICFFHDRENPIGYFSYE